MSTESRARTCPADLIPDHTTLSRLLQKLGEIRFRRPETGRPIHLLIDSTGLRIHVGHLREPPKRRAWRKPHLAVDASTGEIVASDLTGRRTRDSAQARRAAEVQPQGRAGVPLEGRLPGIPELRLTGLGGQVPRPVVHALDAIQARSHEARRPYVTPSP